MVSKGALGVRVVLVLVNFRTELTLKRQLLVLKKKKRNSSRFLKIYGNYCEHHQTGGEEGWWKR